MNDPSTKHLMFQALFFFKISCKILCQNLSNWLFLWIYKNKNKEFEYPKSIRNYKKKSNAWNIRHLVDESYVPANQWSSVLYCRLLDFKLGSANEAFLAVLSQTLVYIFQIMQNSDIFASLFLKFIKNIPYLQILSFLNNSLWNLKFS